MTAVLDASRAVGGTSYRDIERWGDYCWCVVQSQLQQTSKHSQQRQVMAQMACQKPKSHACK